MESMMIKGRITRVPMELLREAELVKKESGCKTNAEAFRRIAQEYSPTGREIKKLTAKKFIAKIIRGK